MKKLLFLLLWIPLAAPLLRAQSDTTGYGDPIRYLDNPSLTAQQRHYAERWQNSDHTAYWRYLQIDPGAFNQTLLTIPLPDGSAWLIRKKRDKENVPGYRSWLGRAEGGGGYANFVLHGDMVTADLALGGARYAIHPLTNGLHLLVKSTGDFPNDETREAYTAMQEQSKISRGKALSRPQHNPENQTAPASSSYDCKIRLLLVMTDDVWGGLADPRAEAINCIDNVNSVFDNSDFAEDRLELARLLRENYAETGDLHDARDDFRNDGDGILDGIHDAREAYDADLCALIVADGGGLCGTAYSIGAFSPEDAFCVVKWDNCAITNYSLAHELGHLFGCRHDLYVDSDDEPYEYAHGFVNLDAEWRTVMAYDDECEDNGTPCARIPYFSNPDIDYGGDPLGVEDESDNTRALLSSLGEMAQLLPLQENKIMPDDIVETSEIADVQAGTSVQNEDDYIIEDGASVTWRSGAGTFILNPGFMAHSGSTFQTIRTICIAAYGGSAIQPGSTALRGDMEQPSGSATIDRLEVSPNPVQDRATVKFSLSRPAVASLDLISTTGSTRIPLARNLLWPEGESTMSFDFRLPPGVYFCRLQTGDATRTVRMVCLN